MSSHPNTMLVIFVGGLIVGLVNRWAASRKRKKQQEQTPKSDWDWQRWAGDKDRNYRK